MAYGSHPKIHPSYEMAKSHSLELPGSLLFQWKRLHLPSPKTLQRRKTNPLQQFVNPHLSHKKKSIWKILYIYKYITTSLWLYHILLDIWNHAFITTNLCRAPWHIPSFGRTAGPTENLHRTSLEKGPGEIVECRGFFGRGRGLKGNAQWVSSWWFQPLWKILDKMGIFPK